MSIIGLLLGWTGLPKWATELLAIVAISGALLLGYAVWHHKVYDAGIAAQKASDASASAALLHRVEVANAALADRQRVTNAKLEASNAQLSSSNNALADSFAVGLRHAFQSGRQGAVSSNAPAASIPDAAAYSSASDAAVMQNLDAVLNACAEDDATLTSLQAYVVSQLALFGAQPSH
ncbi:MAG: hypothetical protein ACRD0E_00095 [Acidimicrobiales bacterium]